MKKLILLMLLPLGAFSQTLKDNYVDEFTKQEVKITSWENIGVTSRWSPYVRLRSVNGNVLFEMKVLLEKLRNKVYSIDRDASLMLKLENDSVVTLHAVEGVVSCTGCGAINLIGSSARGIYVKYPVDAEGVSLLKQFKIVKMRIYTSEGFEEDDIKEKKQETLRKLFALFN